MKHRMIDIEFPATLRGWSILTRSNRASISSSPMELLDTFLRPIRWFRTKGSRYLPSGIWQFLIKYHRLQKTPNVAFEIRQSAC